MVDCSDLIRPELEKYVREFDIKPDNEGCLVRTPFQHPDGDLMRIWVENDAGDYYTIRDYGETFAYLKLRGADPSSEARQERISNIHKQFGLESSAGEVRIRSHTDDLGTRVFDMIQALLSISHLVYTHRRQAPSRFNESVANYLDSVGYQYDSNISVRGDSKDFTFDFGINHREKPTLINTIHTNDPYDLDQKVEGVLLKWWETHEQGYKHGAIIDNVDGIYNQKAVAPLDDKLDYLFDWEHIEAMTQQIPIKA